MATNSLGKFRMGNLVVICGNVETNGTGTPVVPSGLGYTAAYSATGVYTVTLDDKYNQLISCTCDLERAATSELQVSHTATTLGDDDDAATLVFSVSLGSTDAGALSPVNYNQAATATADGEIIHFTAVFLKTDSYGTV